MAVHRAMRPFWARNKSIVLRIAISVMLVAAVVWLGYETWRLLFQQGRWGAIDLRIYHRLIGAWFAGSPIYKVDQSAVHPPATYVLLWPLLGWLSFPAARWFWAATATAALAWLIALILKESRADAPLERMFVAALPLSMYATGAAIGNGQLITHLLPCLVFSVVVLSSERIGWRSEVFATLLFLFTLTKPTLSVPFFWIVLFSTGTIRPAVLIGAGYLAVTLVALSFQDDPITTILHGWLSNPNVARQRGQSNLHVWLTDLGLPHWRFPAAILLLLGHGAWTYRHRHAPVWILMAVAALAARVWTYHAWYDDLLILIPLIALFRMAKEPSANDLAMQAGALLGVGVLAMLAPGGLYLFPAPWNTVYTTAQVVVWSAMLALFLRRAAAAPSGTGRNAH